MTIILLVVGTTVLAVGLFGITEFRGEDDRSCRWRSWLMLVLGLTLLLMTLIA